MNLHLQWPDNMMQESLPILALLLATASNLMIENGTDPLLVIEPGILGNRELLLWCIMGALFGGYLATYISVKEGDTHKTIALKLTSSSIVSIAFTPMMMLYLNIKLRPEWVLGCSCFLAIIGVGVIKGLTTAWTRFFINKLKP